MQDMSVKLLTTTRAGNTFTIECDSTSTAWKFWHQKVKDENVTMVRILQGGVTLAMYSLIKGD